jgi:hypothetical protein
MAIIGSLFRIYVVVVVKFDFGRLSRRLNPSKLKGGACDRTPQDITNFTGNRAQGNWKGGLHSNVKIIKVIRN